MKELSLFSGAGGGLLGTKLLGFKHVGYVENEEYCQKIIRQRIIDGILDNAPIFGDIREFINQGYAERYRGMVDIITAGFPCQPFSVAGKQKGEEDERNMWPQTIDVIRRVRPKYCLLENVPGLLAHEYARRIYGDLAESGFNARWRVLSAAEMGAPHKRDRVWLFCTNTLHSTRSTKQEREHEGAKEFIRSSEGGMGSVVGDPKGKSSDVINDNREGGRREISEPGNPDSKKHVSDASGERSQGRPEQQEQQGEAEQYSRGFSGSGGWWETEPGMGRVVDGVAHRVDRLKAIGNGQVPAVVKKAFELLK